MQKERRIVTLEFKLRLAALVILTVLILSIEALTKEAGGKYSVEVVIPAL
jgi:hypothetical protein